MKTFKALLAASSLTIAAAALAHDDHSHHNHGGHHHAGHASPIGLSHTHTHAKGEFMLTYKYMGMNMEDLRNGDSKVDASDELIANGGTYNIVPTEMWMDMHMFGGMYGVTDELTVMAMVPYHFKSMDHLTNGGATFTTDAEGLGDLKLSGIYEAFKKGSSTVLVNAGLSVPTGSIDERDTTPAGTNQKLPYAMQLGSGTYDLLPGITYLYDNHNSKWSFGGQAQAIIRIDENSNDYTFGDELKLNAWTGYNVHENGNAFLRLQGLARGDIEGEDTELNASVIPTADPNNYGVARVEAFVGYSYDYDQHRVSFEAGLPLYERWDGINMATDYSVTAAYQLTF